MTLPLRRTCEWCRGPIPAGKRIDATTCSQRCRQAKARFKVRQAERLAGELPMRFALADPPYPGKSRKWYREHPEFGGEVDHRELVDRLVAEYPDGWALCTSAEALREVWALCPPATRLCIWSKGARPAPSFDPLRAFDAVLISGGRRRPDPVIEELTDVLECHYLSRPRSHPDAVPGMKPAAFCEWVFRLLGAAPGDRLDDLFPGSGAVARAWSLYTTGRMPSDDGQLELAQ